MSENWRTYIEDLCSIESEQPDLLELQIDACLLAMVRHLVEAHWSEALASDAAAPPGPHPLSADEQQGSG